MKKVLENEGKGKLCAYIHDVEYLRRRKEAYRQGNPYAEIPLYLQILRPLGQVGKRLPLVLFVVGGGFREPKVKFRLPWLVRLAEQGFVVVLVGYRGVETAGISGMADDIRKAVDFAHCKAEEYGADPEKIVLIGASAGGYLALKTGYSLAGRTERGPIKGVIDLYGVTDPAQFLRQGGTAHLERYCLAMGMSCETDPEQIYEKLEQESVFGEIFSERELPPTLIAHGLCDTLVPAEQSERLYEALRAAKQQADLYLVKGAAHADMCFFQPEMMDLYAAFIREVTQ